VEVWKCENDNTGTSNDNGTEFIFCAVLLLCNPGSAGKAS